MTFPTITPPSHEWQQTARRYQDRLTKPLGSLGRLEDLGVWLCACQEQCPPRQFTHARLVVFAGDHGIAAAHPVSPYPADVTRQMLLNMVQGGTGVNALCRNAGVGWRVVDMSVRGAPFPGDISAFRVREASGSIDCEDALTRAECEAALQAGRMVCDSEVADGADLLVAGELGIGNTSPAAAIIGVLCGLPAEQVVGRGSGIDDAGLANKTAAVAAAIARGLPSHEDPMGLLTCCGGADLAAMAGFLAQAAVRHIPVVLDGVIVGACALLAEMLAPGARSWWVAGHQSAEPVHAAALDALELSPLLDLGLRLGEGSGAVCAVPLLRGAIHCMTDMTTFDDVEVSGRLDAQDGIGPRFPTTEV